MENKGLHRTAHKLRPLSGMAMIPPVAPAAYCACALSGERRRGVEKHHMNLKHWRLMGLLLLAGPANMHAEVLVGDATLGPGGALGDYELTLASSPYAFFVGFDFTGGDSYSFSTSGNGYSIAEGFRLFQVPLGTELTPAYAASATPLFDNINPANWQISVPLDSSVYLAYWDDREALDYTPTANDGYGWIQLTRTAAGLEGGASATALGGGIIVGTTMAIPEPSTMALVILGGLALFRRAKKGQVAAPKALRAAATGPGPGRRYRGGAGRFRVRGARRSRR